jgi:hypothetical protein
MKKQGYPVLVFSLLAVASTLQAQPDWVPKVIPPQQRVHAAMAYDAARGQMVLFGGIPGATSIYNLYFFDNDTWVFDGWKWTRMNPAHKPDQRTFSAMAFDPVRQQVILYGGSNCPPGVVSCPYDTSDTWAWDGNDWNQLTPAHNPGPVDHHLMATDTARSRIVLFYNGQTWEWDGTDWTQRQPQTSPSARWMSGMAYDAQRGYTVLFGGRTLGAGATDLADTWLWDGSNWTLAGTFYGPPARSFHKMVYDAERRQVLIFTGINPGVSFYNDVWGWDGLKWTQLSGNCAPCLNSVYPILREGAVAAYDTKRQFSVLYGGLIQSPPNSYTPDYLDDTWLWDGAIWTGRTPLHREGGQMVWDSARNQAVMFGGWVADYSYNGSISIPESNETWLWDGAAWTLKNPAHKPPPRRRFGMAYDAARQQVLIFGGLQGSSTLSDMWTWDGNDWTRLTPAPLPPARQSFRMAYDALNQRVILFGGTGTTGLNDTWMWDGAVWTQLTPTTVPPAMSGYAMAYDPVRQRIMMVGGTYVAVFDGTNNWTVLSSPPSGLWGQMVWDAALAKMVLYNGSKLWTWDGTNWAQLTTTTTLPARSEPQMAYDEVQGQVVLNGGDYSIGLPNPYPIGETWVLTAPETTGDIHVQTNRPEALYSITGPASYNGTGTSSSWSGVAPGAYTITYGTVPGYITPDPVTLTLAAGSSIGFTSGYAALPGTIQVTSNVATSFVIGGSIPYSGSGTSFSQSNVPAGVYTINFAPLAGYVTPAPQTQTLALDGTITFTAIYTALPATCTLTVTTNVAGASFAVAGPASYSGSGTSFSQAGVPPGTYTITYNSVAGYTTPAPDTKTVASGGTLAFTGTYQSGAPPANPGWVLKTPAPHGRANFGAVYDGARQQVVMFGGTRGNPIDETWVYDGVTWTRKRPAHSPPAQEDPLMAYDAARQNVVLASPGATVFDTWTWDGTDWTQMNPAASPPVPDYYWAMAYDAAHQQAILVLSFYGVGLQTWAWDGTNWSQKASFGSPYNEAGYAVFDGARNQVVLENWGYVQISGAWILARETWVFDGTTWTLKATSATNPNVPQLGRMAYDQARQQTVLFDESGSNAATWVWDGSVWTQDSPASTPSKRNAPLVFDPSSSQVWMMGGFDSGTNLELTNDIWAWDGTNWTQKTSTPAYPVHNSATMVYDAARGEVVQFGGNTTAQWTAETWTWNGSTWTQKNPENVPHLRGDSALAYDAARRQVVMFGGDGYYLWLNDTWVWDGANWTQKFPSQVPPNRRGDMMAYDAVRGVVVLFGGKGYSGVLNDTWTWNGSNWTPMSPAASPPARELGAMSFDPARGTVLLFGGQDASSNKLGDTWEWDGTNWTQRTPATSPAARAAASVAYDTLRGYTLLFGGNTAASGWVFRQDTWSWDGTNWTQQNSADSPPAAIVEMTYDAARGQVTTFGGWTVGHLFAVDVWVWDQVGAPPTSGTITVNTNLAGASFSLSGPASYSGSGTSWSQSNAPAGSYTISFNAVTGYTTPASQTVTLAAGGTLTFTGTYTATATHFGVSAPGSATAGSGFSFTVTAQDVSNNTVTGYAGTVHFSSSDSQAVLPANATLTNGVGTFSATLRTAGNHTLTATDTVSSSVTGTSGTIAVGASAAVLSIVKSHPGDFTQGQQDAAYRVVVSNAAGAASTSGTVRVTETPPSGLTLVSMGGTGWACASNSCTRSDALAAAASYPAITVTVNVGINATSPQGNQVSVTWGGAGLASAADSTVITPMAGGAATLFGLLFSKAGTQAERQWTFEVGNSGSGTAAAAEIDSVQLTQTSLGGGSACTPVITNPSSFPLALGNILAGAWAQGTVTIDFTGCANAAEFTVLVRLSANGGASTGGILRHNEER